MKTLESYFGRATGHFEADAEHETGTSAVADDETFAPCRTANILREVDRNGLCILTFDRKNSSANILDRDTLMELAAHLDWVEHTGGLRGLILTSAKEKIFIAGADIHALAQAAEESVAPATQPDSKPIASREEGEHAESPVEVKHAMSDLILLGQQMFNRIEALTIPTLAAIHGACVGGGYELALACRYRIASDDRATKIGLPEILLGILPAWGGSTRLPRLVGIPKALEVILNGKTLVGERALKLGMIDEVVPRDRLMQVARERILHPVKPHRASLRVSNNSVSAALIRARVTRELTAKTRGNYPAPFEALDVVTHGVSLSTEKSLERERVALARLVKTSACRNLLRLFLMKETVKKSRTTTSPVTRTAVIGAGVMGAGIAQWFSARGLPVILRDVSLAQLVNGMAIVSSLYEDGVRRHHLTKVEARDGKDRIFAAATDMAMRDVDLVVEAATEKLALKKDIFRILAAQTGPGTILATNTSALSITEIAATTGAAERVVGLHFFNPVHRMELVEVIPGQRTSPEVLARTVEFARRMGKVPVVSRDRPGFIVNRILMPYLVEAVRLVDQGGNIHDIDESMLDFGMPMGPLRLLDEVGLDVAAHVVNSLAGHFGERVTAPGLIEKMLGAGMLGKKSGRGFYEYAHHKPNHELDVLRSIHRHAHFTHDEVSKRLSLLMVNEAARGVEEGVASPADIDLAMVLGTGFAPFHGGPLRYADALGADQVRADLEKLAGTDPRFAPCELLKSMAATNQPFHPLKGAKS